MTKARKLFASLLVSGALAAGAVAAPTPASAQLFDDPCPSIDFVLVHADMTGVAYSINNHMVPPAPTFLPSGGFSPCRYEGDMYYSAGSHGTTPMGTYRFTRPAYWNVG